MASKDPNMSQQFAVSKMKHVNGSSKSQNYSKA
jgi:hypothetical protein